MSDSKPDLSRRLIYGWLLFAAGLLLILIGLAIRLWAPNVALNVKWISVFGILVTAFAIANLPQAIQSVKDPERARRAMYEASDERSLGIRRRSGYAAFIFSNLVSILALLVYSFTTRSVPGPDRLWYYLAFMVLAPGMVYIIGLTYYHERE